MAGRKGAIAFGLVYIPVELFTATQDDAVRFNQLAKDSMKRVRYVKTCPDCKRELKPEDIVKGYQYEKGKYVVVDDEELDVIKTDADRAMKIVQFSDIDEVPPLYFEKPYQVGSPARRREGARTASTSHGGRRQRSPSARRCWAIRKRPSRSSPTTMTWS